MKVRVELRHIKAGKRNMAYECPIALAIKDILHNQVSVGTLDMRLWVGSRYFTWGLPYEAQRFIVDYDKGYSLQPFEFETTSINVYEL